jgi:hypothetical protein
MSGTLLQASLGVMDGAMAMLTASIAAMPPHPDFLVSRNMCRDALEILGWARESARYAAAAHLEATRKEDRGEA